MRITLNRFGAVLGLQSEWVDRRWSYNIGTVPTTVVNVSNATAIASRGDHTCALLTGGTITCWGDNPYGQLGLGNQTNFLPPSPVDNISTAVSVATGASHTCAALSDGTVQCWGLNDNGELGNGTTTASSTPITVFGF